MGELRNCPNCGKVFVKINRNLCPDCIQQEERDFEEVRKYLKDYPGASVSEIAEVTGIEENKILKWIREGRLDASYHGTGSAVTCKRCGVSIPLGNLCTKCARELASQIKSISGSRTFKEESDQSKDSKSTGMFVAERLRNEE